MDKMDENERKEFEKTKEVALGGGFRLIREAALTKLLQLDETATIPILLEILQNHDEESTLRSAAARELGKSGNQEAVPVLCSIMEKEMEREFVAVRSGASAIGAEYTCGSAAQALGMMADSRAAIPLLKALEMNYNLQQSKEVSKSSWPLRHMEDALEKVLLRNGVEYLRNSLDELHGLLDAKNPKVRETTADLLGRLADFRSLEPLLSALEKESAASRESRFADRLLQALGSVCDRCKSVDGLRLYEKKVGKALGRLMKCDGVEVPAGLKALESRAKKKRRECAKLGELLSTAEAMLVFESAVRATRQGMRKTMKRLRRASN